MPDERLRRTGYPARRFHGVADRRKARAVSGEPFSRPTFRRPAIRCEEGDIRRPGGLDADIAPDAGIEPLLVLDDGKVDAMAGEKRGHAAARIHHHNFYLRFLFEQRPDRVNCLDRRTERNHDYGQARRPRTQGIRPQESRSRMPTTVAMKGTLQRSTIAHNAYAEE